MHLGLVEDALLQQPIWDLAAELLIHEYALGTYMVKLHTYKHELAVCLLILNFAL